MFLQESGPLDSEAMVMGVLDQSFDVLVLRYGVQKRIYCKVSSNNVFYNVIFFLSKIPIYSQVLIFYFLVIKRLCFWLYITFSSLQYLPCLCSTFISHSEKEMRLSNERQSKTELSLYYFIRNGWKLFVSTFSLSRAWTHSAIVRWGRNQSWHCCGLQRPRRIRL